MILIKKGLTVILTAGLFSGLVAPVTARAQETYNSGMMSIGGTYELIQPSVGLMMTTQRMNVLRVDLGNKLIVDKTATPVEVGMGAILYDAQGQAWREKGRVLMVGADTVSIEIPVDETTPEIKYVDVILHETRSARRLPVDVLSNGQLWKAHAMAPPQYVLEPVNMNVEVDNGTRIFDAGDAVRADEYVVMNPNASLREGGVITAHEVITVDMPNLDPQELARNQSYAQGEVELLALIDSTIPQIDPNDVTATGGTCGPVSSGNELQDTLMRLRSSCGSSEPCSMFP